MNKLKRRIALHEIEPDTGYLLGALAECVLLLAVWYSSAQQFPGSFKEYYEKAPAMRAIRERFKANDFTYEDIANGELKL